MKKLIFLSLSGILLIFSSVTAKPVTGNEYFGLSIGHTDIYSVDVWTNVIEYNMNLSNESEDVGVDLYTSFVYADTVYGDEFGFAGALPIFFPGSKIIPYVAPVFGYSGNEYSDHVFYGGAVGIEFLIGEKGNFILEASRLESEEYGNLGVNIGGELLFDVVEDIKMGLELSWNDLTEEVTYGVVMRWFM